MFPEQNKVLLAGLLALALVLGACGEDPAPAQKAPEEIVEETPTPGPELVASSKARVKFKGGQRYAEDLSRGLGLPRLELCQELGSFDCVDMVHNITLGGVEPYRMSIFEPLPVDPVTAPIAVDRVALAGCARRAEADFDDPGNAVLFGELASGDEAEASYEAAAVRLYQRLLLREAQPHELEILLAFRDDVAEEAEEAERTRAWSTMSCFMVATSMEALFY